MTHPRARDNWGKLQLIPDRLMRMHVLVSKGSLLTMLPLEDGSMSYQLVGGVTAYQGDDG